MNVAGPSALSQSQSSSSASTAKNAVDYQSFLKLLVAEMKNQDPTSPMESTDYVAQLATFSQVEQSVQIKEKLDDILQATALTQAASMIGKFLTSADGGTSGIVAEVKVTSDGVVAKLESGEEVPIGPGVSIKAEA